MTKIGKLGRRPPKNAPALRLSSFLQAIPDHPLAEDNLTRVPTWILGGNDKYSDCGPVSVANDRLQITTYLTDQPMAASQFDIFDLYRRSGNPDFDPATDNDDNGVDMQTMLEALMEGGIAGIKPVCFAKIDHTNIDEIDAALAIFGSCLFGVTLDDAQKKQSPTGQWDYSPSQVWGGHAILSGSYRRPGTSDDRIGVVTWAQVMECTDAFIENQLEEAWVVIWPEHLGTSQFEQGIDSEKLAAAYRALTGDTIAQLPSPTPIPIPKTGCVLAALALIGVGVLVALTE
jgi:hypothetical protein